jgi:hypothetical protein
MSRLPDYFNIHVVEDPDAFLVALELGQHQILN